MFEQPATSADPSKPNKPAISLRLGRLVSTPGAIEAMTRNQQDPLVLLNRHRSGDWGELDEHDRAANDRAATEGGERVLSSYRLADGTTVIWIITEADRSATTVLLPDEY